MGGTVNANILLCISQGPRHKFDSGGGARLFKQQEGILLGALMAVEQESWLSLFFHVSVASVLGAILYKLVFTFIKVNGLS